MSRWSPLRVGLLVLAAAALLTAFLAFVKKGGMGKRDSRTAVAWFKDATGLAPRSRVQVAGIPVGEVESIQLVGTRAQVTLRIRDDVALREDAVLSKRSESLLGDYLLELYPGSDEAEPLAPGGEITRVVDQQGMDAVFGSLQEITSDIREVTRTLREVLGSEGGAGALQRLLDNLVRVSESLDRTLRQSSRRLEAILYNVEQASRSVRALGEEQREPVREVVANVNAITRDVRDVLASVKEGLGTGDGELRDTVTALREALDSLGRSLGHVEKVTAGLEEGKGVAGTLLRDERAAQKLNETIEDVSAFTSRLTQLRAEVSVRSEYLFEQGAGKNYLQFRLFPRADKHYLLELVDDPRGTTETVFVQANPPSAGDPATQVQRVTRDSLKVSAQFAKRYYFATLRMGITESTGGVGMDLHFFDDALSLRMDAFDFALEFNRSPRLRAALRVQALNHLFATAGVDDALNAPVREVSTGRLILGRDFFVGAGVYFTDEDLQAILSLSPIRP
ncbi:MAG: hypothetical protein RL653_1722 [Pseudomonadota bacterium]